MDGASSSRSRSIPLFWLLTLIGLTAGEGCAPYIGTTYQSFLNHARENPDPNIRYVAYAKLGNPGLYESKAQKEEAVKLLIAKLDAGKEPVAVRAAIVRSLGNLGDQRARDVVLSAVNDKDNPVIRVEACRALGKVGLPEDATLLARIMLIDILIDCRVAAIEAIGQLKAEDPRIYQILLDGMDHEDPAIRRECLYALRELTHKDYGIDPAAWKRELEPVIAAMAKTTTPPPTTPPQNSPPQESPLQSTLPQSPPRNAVVRTAPSLR